MTKSFGHMNIGPTRYTLLNDDLGPELAGTQNQWHLKYNKAVIALHEDLPKEQRTFVFVHEVVHALTSDYLAPEYKDEAMVTPFSSGLYMCVRDNKKVWRKIVEGTI